MTLHLKCKCGVVHDFPFGFDGPPRDYVATCGECGQVLIEHKVEFRLGLDYWWLPIWKRRLRIRWESTTIHVGNVLTPEEEAACDWRLEPLTYATTSGSFALPKGPTHLKPNLTFQLEPYRMLECLTGNPSDVARKITYEIRDQQEDDRDRQR
jgi:hypothetical protein